MYVEGSGLASFHMNYKHPWLSMYNVYTRSITKLKRVIDPKRIALWRIKLYWYRPESNVTLIDNHFALDGCLTKYCYGPYINTYFLIVTTKVFLATFSFSNIL